MDIVLNKKHKLVSTAILVVALLLSIVFHTIWTVADIFKYGIPLFLVWIVIIRSFSSKAPH